MYKKSCFFYTFFLVLVGHHIYANIPIKKYMFMDIQDTVRLTTNNQVIEIEEDSSDNFFLINNVCCPILLVGTAISSVTCPHCGFPACVALACTVCCVQFLSLSATLPRPQRMQIQ